MARGKRNEFVAGLFILVMLAALAAVLILAGSWEHLTSARTTYYVAFDQAPGVRSGSPVLLRGRVVGRVTDVQMRSRKATPPEPEGPDAPEPEPVAPDAVEYFFVLALDLPKEICLRRNAIISIETKLIGEDAAINIRSAGTNKAALDTEHDPIAGRGGDAMTAAVEALGIGEAEKARIRQTIDDIGAITASLRETTPKIGRVMDNIETVTADLKEKLPAVLASVNEGVTTLKSAADRVDGILAENREKIKTSVANVSDLMENAKKQVDELLANLKTVSADIRTVVASNRMNLTDSMVNIRETSEQLKAAAKEIRRAPWRLLYKPDDRAADSLNIFDASRNYANAAADLRSIASTFEAIIKLKDEGMAVDEQLIQDMLDRIKAGLKRYEEAESALWKQWGDVSK